MEKLADPLREILLPKLKGVTKSGDSWAARCPVPAHDDSTASMSVGYGDTQPVVLKCHRGCTPDEILDALGLTWADLCKPQEDRQPAGEWTPNGPAEAVYDYTDENGDLLFQVVRCPGKRFMQRRPDRSAKSGWTWKLGDTRRVPYRLQKVIKGITDGEMIFVCEGEKDVHAIEAAGHVATCNPGGAGPGKWLPAYSEFLREAIVTIIADRDDPGREHARRVAAALEGVAASVEIWEPAHGKDAADHLGAGLAIRDFNKPEGNPGRGPDLDPDINEFLLQEDPPEDWVIEKLIEHGERLIVTGIEGFGKTTLLRQISVCSAAGIHPFSGKPMNPVVVVYVDCENTMRQSRKKFRELVNIAEDQGHPIPAGGLRVIHRPEGIDLTRDEDSAWLMERTALYRPDLLMIGPLYRLHLADTNEELPARRVAAMLDAVRVASNCALIVEAHSGHANGGFKRNLRPIGSSLFLRWPEFGYGMDPVEDSEAKNLFNFIPWRGGRDRDREWPRQVVWASGIPGETGWPWQEYMNVMQPGGANPAPRQYKDN